MTLGAARHQEPLERIPARALHPAQHVDAHHGGGDQRRGFGYHRLALTGDLRGARGAGRRVLGLGSRRPGGVATREGGQQQRGERSDVTHAL
jgi:hypothetical protein